MKGLNVTTYATLMKGGESGAVVVPGDPANSLIVKIQTGASPHFGQLKPDQVDQLKTWMTARIADKAFTLSAVVTLAWSGSMPWWEGAVLLVRDVTVGAIAAWCGIQGLREAFRGMRPRLAGKCTTALAFLWFLALLVPGAGAVRLPLFVAAAGASLAAAVDYGAQFLRAVRALRAGAPPPAGVGGPAPRE